VQWYYDKLIPYVNYIPVKTDFSDLDHQYKWALQNDTTLKQIAMAGTKLAKETFSREAIEQAFVNALYEYQDKLQGVNTWKSNTLFIDFCWPISLILSAYLKERLYGFAYHKILAVQM